MGPDSLTCSPNVQYDALPPSCEDDATTTLFVPTHNKNRKKPSLTSTVTRD